MALQVQPSSSALPNGCFNICISFLYSYCSTQQLTSRRTSCHNSEHAKLIKSITAKHIEEVKVLYHKQVPSLCKKDFLTDHCLVYLLAVGRNKGSDYVSNFYEDYTRRRIAASLQNKKLNEYQWANSDDNDLLKNVKEIKIQIKDSQSAYSDVAKQFGFCSFYFSMSFCPKFKDTVFLCTLCLNDYRPFISALSAYQSRIVRKFEFNAPHKINNSMIVVMEYIESICSFISSRLKLGFTICPFQIDLCFVMGEPMDIPDEEDPNDDDEEYIDEIGDIEAKLKSNGMDYIHFASNGNRKHVPRRLHLKWAESGDEKECYHQSRFVLLIDRREQNEKTENVSIYKDTAKIPKDAVAEYYLASTLDKILPAMKVNDVDDANVDDEKENDDAMKEMDSNPIGARNDCNGSMLTLSFQIKEDNKRKVYLYWNGMVLPMEAEYLKTVFPKIFNMKYGENEMAKKGVDRYVEMLEKWLTM